jgi:2-C-methyl-D-erythritol 4-phosphate cytidylyltransferase
VKGASAVIVAAGKGERLGSPKQFVPLGGIPLLLWSVRAFDSHPRIGEVIVVLPAESAATPPDWLRGQSVRWCAGGETRRESAGAGVRSAEVDSAIILIHDAARPFVSHEVIDRVIEAASRTGAALPILPVVDTIKQTEAGQVLETVKRQGLGRAQTPQGFDSALIRGLHSRAAQAGKSVSDDAALCELEGHPVAVVQGDAWNLKITTAADLELAEWLLDSGRMSVPGAQSPSGGAV